MNYNGNLSFSDNGEYILLGSTVLNLSSELDNLLMDKVYIKITSQIGDKSEILFDKQGVLYKNNTLEGYVWKYFVDNEDLDEVLFSISDKTFNRIHIEIKQINNNVKYKDTLEVIEK